MPELGEITYGKTIGKSGGKYIWSACEVCGQPRWTQVRNGLPTRQRCMSCKGIGLRPSESSLKKRRKNTKHIENGYIWVRIYPDNPYYSMSTKHRHHGFILEHRLAMAEHLGRCLLRTEQVHHKDGNRANNEISNLELVSPANHALRNGLCANCELRKEIRLLTWQIRELSQALQEKLKI